VLVTQKAARICNFQLDVLKSEKRLNNNMTTTSKTQFKLLFSFIILNTFCWAVVDGGKTTFHKLCILRQPKGYTAGTSVTNSHAKGRSPQSKQWPNLNMSWAQLVPKFNFEQVPILRDQRMRLALAGALAGAFTTGILHPIDTAKTLRQTNPEVFKSTMSCLKMIIRNQGFFALYAGIGPALLGAMPSSALYFGTYESVKQMLQEFCDCHLEAVAPFEVFSKFCRARGLRHSFSAACGNAASSIIFVPKEFLKQSMQACQVETKICRPLDILVDTVRTQGLGGLYTGYLATLSRNIPSAMLRFSIYEEFRRILASSSSSTNGEEVSPTAFFLAGALAGVLSSAITTPLDVVKTKVATGRISRSLSLWSGLLQIAQTEGISGLYAGVQPRILMSGLFTALGFGSFEAFKKVLDCSQQDNSRSCQSKSKSSIIPVLETANSITNRKR